jgi:hypothetical protein
MPLIVFNVIHLYILNHNMYEKLLLWSHILCLDADSTCGSLMCAPLRMTIYLPKHMWGLKIYLILPNSVVHLLV